MGIQDGRETPRGSACPHSDANPPPSAFLPQGKAACDHCLCVVTANWEENPWASCALGALPGWLAPLHPNHHPPLCPSSPPPTLHQTRGHPQGTLQQDLKKLLPLSLGGGPSHNRPLFLHDPVTKGSLHRWVNHRCCWDRHFSNWSNEADEIYTKVQDCFSLAPTRFEWESFSALFFWVAAPQLACVGLCFGFQLQNDIIESILAAGSSTSCLEPVSFFFF